MKKTLKYFALAFVGLVAASCSDDDIISQGRPVAGDEVIFGAEGAFEKGELSGDSKDSRTAYGDVTGEVGNQKIAINWCEGDQLTIACAESPGAKIATYQVPITAAPNPQPAAVGDVVKPGADNSSSTAGILERISAGPAGIQWGPTSSHFYAVYPSIDYTKNKWGDKCLKWDTSKKVLTGHMPSTYTGTAVEETPTAEGHKVYSVQPSMDYAFMVADAQYELPQANAGLKFKPIVTALEFDLELSGLINTEGIKTDYIKVGALELKSKTQSIVGNFKYEFGQNGTPGSITNTSKIEDGTNSIFLKLAEPVQLKVNDRLKATFFIVPTENGDPKVEELLSGDLTLNIMYTDQSFGVFFKKATINHEIDARKKYFFSDMALPPLNPYTTSNWFAQLDDDIYISQLSFPAASHVVSNQYSGTNAQYYREQVHPFRTLWNAGVRGFELRSSFNSTTDKENISAEEFYEAPFVCAGQPLWGVGHKTIGSAMLDGIKALLDNPRETLVYVMTYQSYSGDNSCGYRPDLYLQGLQKCLNKLLQDPYVKGKGIQNASDLFVQLNSNSTVADLRGKLAIVVRLYDNAYVDDTNKGNVKKVKTANLVPSSEWKPYISVIDDWGTCIDNFDVRYGDTYAREGQFVRNGRTAFEDNMWWRISEEKTVFKSIRDKGNSGKYDDHPKTKPFPSALLADYNFVDMPLSTAYQFNVNQGYGYKLQGDPAYVQCWERVIPATKQYYLGSESWWETVNNGTFLKPNNQEIYARLWYEWPESINEKLQAIKYMTETSIRLRNSEKLNLFINSLAGYFPLPAKDGTANQESFMEGSINPYYTKVVYHWGGASGRYYQLNLNGSIKEGTHNNVNSQVTGGDYVTCSAVLNTSYYRYLTSKTAEQFGPLGLVMMDFVGASKDDFSVIDTKLLDYGIKVSTPGFSDKSISSAEASKASTELPRLIIANNFHFPLKQKKAKAVYSTDTSSPQQIVDNGNIISFEK